MAGSHRRALTPRRRVPRSFRVIRALRARGQQREVQSPCTSTGPVRLRHENLLRQSGGQTHGPRARRTQGARWRALARYHLASDHPSLAVQCKHNTTHPAHHPARRHQHGDGRAGAAEAEGDERERRQAQRHRAHGPSAAVSSRRSPRRESPGPISDRATCLAHHSPPTPVAPISLIESPISTSDRLAGQCCALIGRYRTICLLIG